MKAPVNIFTQLSRLSVTRNNDVRINTEVLRVRNGSMQSVMLKFQNKSFRNVSELLFVLSLLFGFSFDTHKNIKLSLWFLISLDIFC